MPKDWSRFENWHLVLPPNRPPTWYLNIVREWMSGIDRRKAVGVLGCTPEIRDVLASMGFGDVFLFDKSQLFKEKMDRLCCYSTTERLVVGDWLETLEANEATLAVLISDLTLGNVAYSMRPAFYRGVRQVLRPGGLFIDRVLTHPIPNLSLDSLDGQYVSMPFNLATVNAFSAQYLFSSELLDLKQVVDSSAFYDLLGERFVHPVLRRLLESCEQITPSDTVWYYGQSWAQVSPAYLGGRVTVLAEYEDDEASPFAGRVRAFVMRRQ